MAAGRYDILIEQGSTFSRSLQWKDEAGTVVPLDNLTARMQIRARDCNGTVVADMTTENGGINMNTTTDKIELLLTAVQTALIPSDVYVYDLEIYSTGDVVYRLLQGNVNLECEVTHE